MAPLSLENIVKLTWNKSCDKTFLLSWKVHKIVQNKQKLASGHFTNQTHKASWYRSSNGTKDDTLLPSLMVMVFVCLYDTAHSSHHVYSRAFTILSCLHPNYLWSEQGNSGCGETRDSESTGTSTFLPRNKTIVCWWYEIVGYQGVTATTSPSQETMAGQSRDKIVQVASSSSGCAGLGWGRLNKSKVTTGDDYLDKPYLVSV